MSEPAIDATQTPEDNQFFCMVSWAKLVIQAGSEDEFIAILQQPSVPYSKDNGQNIGGLSRMISCAVKNNWIKASRAVLQLSEQYCVGTNVWSKGIMHVHTPEMLDVFFERKMIASPFGDFWLEHIAANQTNDIFQLCFSHLLRRGCPFGDLESTVSALIRHGHGDAYAAIVPHLTEGRRTEDLEWACCLNLHPFIDLLYTPERAMQAKSLRQADGRSLNSLGWAYMDGLEITQAIGDVGSAVARRTKL